MCPPVGEEVSESPVGRFSRRARSNELVQMRHDIKPFTLRQRPKGCSVIFFIGFRHLGIGIDLGDNKFSFSIHS